MITAEISASTLSRPHRAISFSVFLISGLTLFLLQVFAFNRSNHLFQICVFVGLPVVFSLITYLLYQNRAEADALRKATLSLTQDLHMDSVMRHCCALWKSWSPTLRPA